MSLACVVTTFYGNDSMKFKILLKCRALIGCFGKLLVGIYKKFVSLTNQVLPKMTQIDDCNS